MVEGEAHKLPRESARVSGGSLNLIVLIKEVYSTGLQSNKNGSQITLESGGYTNNRHVTICKK